MTDAGASSTFDGFDKKDVLGGASTDPREMRVWPHSVLPPWLVAFELEIGPNLDVRYRRRTIRIPISDQASLEAALTAIHAGSAADYREPRADRMRSALSIGVSGKLIYALLLDRHLPAKSQLRFSSVAAPFMAGSEQALGHQFSPRNVSFASGRAVIGEPGKPALEASDGRLAFFMIDLDNADQYDKSLPFNINLEVRGRLHPGQGGSSFITPIIIDPDMRHPPTGGGIPTYP